MNKIPQTSSAVGTVPGSVHNPLKSKKDFHHDETLTLLFLTRQRLKPDGSLGLPHACMFTFTFVLT